MSYIWIMEFSKNFCLCEIQAFQNINKYIDKLIEEI